MPPSFLIRVTRLTGCFARDGREDHLIDNPCWQSAVSLQAQAMCRLAFLPMFYADVGALTIFDNPELEIRVGFEIFSVEVQPDFGGASSDV
jgi:hypothetical protein